MSNYIMKTAGADLSNIASLSVIPADSYYCPDNAAGASEKFFRSATLLPKGEFLGWQLHVGKDSVCSSFAFSSAETEVSAEDFNWIFQNCAVVNNESMETFTDLGDGQRKVYALRFQPDGKNEGKANIGRRNRSMYHSESERDYFGEMLDMMGEAGAILRIISISDGNRFKGCGEILISLPDTITLRMLTILSIAFPHTTVEDIQDSRNDCGELPMECITAGMTGMLKTLMFKAENKREVTGEEYEECDEYEELWDEEEYPEEDDVGSACVNNTGFTPIEELELCARAYNCLKRAGMNSIEQLRAMSDDELRRVRNLGQKSFEDVKKRLAEIPQLSAPAPLTTQDYASMLDELIGLAEVKEQVRKITAFGRMKKDMADRGENAVPVVLNMEFVGNPGTAKTTVARIIAGIFHEAGILPSNEIVEAGRADLVARYEGQTADKVKSVFRQAKGKLLFIDEAYSLVENQEGEFGDEAINTIVQEMENNREDTIVVFAGYPDKMEEFFSRNPGLRSRVPFRICFSDYSTDEMIKIVELEAHKRGFTIQPQTREKISSICESASGEANAGNGRFCRNLVENAVLEYAARVYGNGKETGNRDFVLVDSDFSASAAFQNVKKQIPMGFRL